MNCPVCSVALQMTERQGVEVDYCPQCRGVWLDRGELDKILERSTTIAAPQVQGDRLPGYEQPRGSENRGYENRGYEQRGGEYRGDYPRHHKKKNWLEEIFD